MPSNLIEDEIYLEYLENLEKAYGNIEDTMLSIYQDVLILGSSFDHISNSEEQSRDVKTLIEVCYRYFLEKEEYIKTSKIKTILDDYERSNAIDVSGILLRSIVISPN